MEEINSKKRKYMYIAGPLVLFIALIGITYAFFNYTRTGVSNTIRVGRVSFVTRQIDTINLTNVFPISSSEATGENHNYDEVVIEIEGDTDYTGGIEYLVSAVNANIYTNQGQAVPISLDVSVTNLGTPNANYFTARESKNATIYKKLVGDTLVGDQMLLVGYIKPNTTSGTAEGIQNGKLTIKAYLDKDKILISDTYNGTESDNMGTSNSMAQGKTVLTTSEWNALQQNGVSFKVKVEANEGIWVNGSLEEIMRKSAVMDNVSSTYVSASTGINFGAVSSSTNGKGVYMRAGTENDAYPIVYYRGAVEDNNVLFNNQCWKAVRTTDTGGVKLIYSGLPGEIYGIGPLAESSYTKNTTNTDSRWTFGSSDSTWNIEITDNSQPAIEFTVPQGDNYTMVMTGTSGSSCGGQFSFYKNGTSVNGNSNGGGGAMNLTYNFGTLTSTDVIKMNYSGSSSSTCAITFKLKMLGQGEKITDNGCNNTGVDTHINISGTNTFPFSGSNLYKSPAYNGYMWGTVYEWTNSAPTSGAYFGNGFEYSNGVYTLTNAKVGYDGTHHYSCNSTSIDGTCASIRYYYYTNYYITLTNGESVEDALKKMQTNTTNSNAKTQIDAWYAANMTGVTSKLEDTIWCNDRSISTKAGWDPNGNVTGSTLYYSPYNRAYNTNVPSLSCTNKNDAFTVNNGNGNQKLTYPVALLTSDEMTLAGGKGGSSSTFYLASGEIYWSLSPGSFDRSVAFGFSVGNSGSLSGDYVGSTGGLRPSVSLKPGMPVVSGDGTISSPYRIEE